MKAAAYAKWAAAFATEGKHEDIDLRTRDVGRMLDSDRVATSDGHV